MTFFSQIIPESPRVVNALEELRRAHQEEHLPIVLYGAGARALAITNFLEKYGLSVDAYFVSDGYEDDAGNMFPNVRTFDGVARTFQKFNVIIARGDVTKSRHDIAERKSSQIIRVYAFAFPIETSTYQDVKRYRQEFEEVYSMLEDAASRKVLVNVINARITGDQAFLQEVVCEDQYFVKEIVPLSSKEVFVDAGAFTGDTLNEFIQKTGAAYTRYYAFEPDTVNCDVLQKLIYDRGLDNVTVYEKGVWSAPGVLSFAAGHGSSSFVSCCNSDDSQFAPSIGFVNVEVDTIDNLCPNASFIKMDIEGAEVEALKGAEKTIKERRPKLAICIYHKFEHIFQIPLFIKKIFPNYRFYMRHHSEVETETVLYAIP